MVQIETARLFLRPFTADDDVALFSIVGGDPDMTWDKTSRSLDRVRKTLQERIEHYGIHGFGVLAMVLKSTGEVVGQCGLQNLPETTCVELVAYTAKKHWNEGLGKEASFAALRFCFEDLHYPSVLAVVRQDNSTANALAAKLGFRFIREDYVYEASVNVYELRSESLISDSI